MARFQLVEFLRKKPTEMLKSDVVWERGIALLDEGENVFIIIDEHGNKLRGEPWNFRKLYGQGFTLLDTKAEGIPWGG